MQPDPCAVPMPFAVQWFTPWRWFRRWTWKTRMVFAALVVFGYLESAVVVIPVCHHLVAAASPLGSLLAVAVTGIELFYLPLGLLMQCAPWVMPFFEAQADWVDSVLTANGI